MKEFYNFEVKITPDQCTQLAAYLTEQKKAVLDEFQPQLSMLIDTVNQIQQAKPIKSPEYYKDISNRDANGFGALHLNIGEKTIIIDNIQEKIASEGITIDNFINYLAKEYKVTVSEAQRNFLRTQWNQASLVGSCSPFINNQISQDVINNPSYHVFNFDSNNNLSSVQYVANYFNVENPTKTGTFTTTADISNLQNSAVTDHNPWIPSCSAKEVSMQYSSKDLPCYVDNAIQESLADHAHFFTEINMDETSKENQNNNANKSWIISIKQSVYENIVAPFNAVITNISNWVSKKIDKIKNYFTKSDKDFSHYRESNIRDSQRPTENRMDTTDSYYTSRSSQNSTDSFHSLNNDDVETIEAINKRFSKSSSKSSENVKQKQRKDSKEGLSSHSIN